MYRVKSSGGSSRNTSPAPLQTQQPSPNRAPLWPSRKRQRLPISRPTGIAALLRLPSATANSTIFSSPSPSMATTLSPLREAAKAAGIAVALNGAGGTESDSGSSSSTAAPVSLQDMGGNISPMAMPSSGNSLPTLPCLRVSGSSSGSGSYCSTPSARSVAATTLTAAENLLRVRAAAPVITMRMVKALINSRLPLLQIAPAHEYVAPLGSREAAAIGHTTWYVLGDIHGDFFALHTLLTTIKARHCSRGSAAATDFRILLLGDMVDRGLHDTETLLLLLDMAMEYPHSVLWLAGNHDEALYLDSGAARFEATVSPSEFKDRLNDLSGTHPFLRALGYLFIAVAARLPRAVLFPDGTLATHAGFPLGDLMPQVKDLSALNAPACLRDFLWTRATPHARRRPARRNEDCATFGHEDFDSFCRATQSFFPVQRLVRGHDHIEQGYRVHTAFQKRPMLTLNSFGHDAVDSSDRHLIYKQRLCLGVMQPGRLPRVDLIPYAMSDFNDYMSVSPISLQNAPATWPTDGDEKNATRQRRAQIAPTPTPLESSMVD